MWVVKLGGSLHDAPALPQRLAELATLPGPARIVVPGGGPFADVVRALQPTLAFDELAAHRMAILAMQQFGLALQAIEPRLALAETDAELRGAKAAVWLPWRLAGLEPALPASWDLTSDSLACWLAIRLAASDLILVKSTLPAQQEADVDAWAAGGLVDPALASWAARYAGRIRLAHGDRPLRFTE